MLCGIALPIYVEHHIVVNACWYVNFHDFLALYDAIAVAVGTGARDDGAFAVTLWTGTLLLHHSKEALVCAYYIS